ncbi:MAG: YqjK-like family protein [Rhodocyclaceae bacterium]|nr:YqjK-like family protein [Rhodocyclaceae bacterium]MDZ4216163.1 YqjK-like family protein [Rhodocyclaceae bacterium]
MSRAVAHALEKQRLQFASAEQREHLTRYGAGIAPLFEAADRVQDGARWVQRHPEVTVGVLALIAAVRPRVRQFLWRWSKRGFVVWKLWRNSARWLEQNSPSSRTP